MPSFSSTMEVSSVSCVVGVAATLMVLYVWRLLNWLWFQPKKIEKFLRDQGLKGTPYRFIFGDLKEMVQMTSEAKSKPMSLTDHDIAHRLLPFFHKSVTTHGKNCFTWMGTKSMVHTSDPTIIREVLANYRQLQKPRDGNPLTKLLARGLVYTETDQWTKHRKIINPAFHVEKIKRMVPIFYVSCNEMILKWDEMMTKENMLEVDVWPHLQTLTADVVSRNAFGSSFEEGRKIFELQTELIVKAVHSIYIPGSRFWPTKNNKRFTGK